MIAPADWLRSIETLALLLSLTAAANRTVGIASHPVLLPFSAQRVIGGKFAVRRRADTEQHFERFGGLGRSDNADQGRKNAEQCTSAVAGLFAVKQAGITRRIGKVGPVHGDLSVKADGRGGNQRRARGNGGAVDRLACGIVVGTIKDDVGSVCQFDKPGLIEKFGHGGNVCLAVDLFQTALHDQSFVFTDVGFGKRDLALKVGLVDGIGIGNRQAADTGGGKIRQGRRAQSAATDNERMGCQEFFLAFDTDFIQQDMAAEPQKLLIVHHNNKAV